MTTCPNCGGPHDLGVSFAACPSLDDRAIAYYTGGADARNGRPRRSTNPHYTRGYVHHAGSWADK